MIIQSVADRRPGSSCGAAGDVKVAVYNCAVDSASTDTKGKVDITNAEQLKSFSRTEEEAMERVITGIAKTGVKVIVSSQSFGDMAAGRASVRAEHLSYFGFLFDDGGVFSGRHISFPPTRTKARISRLARL